MRFFIILAAVAALVGCGASEIGSYESLTSLQPYVVSVEPADGSVVDGRKEVTVEFSRSIAESTVGSTTLAIIKDSGSAIDETLDDLTDGDLSVASGVYEFSGDGTIAVFRPSEDYEKGSRYLVVATTSIRTADGLPLNQNAGQSPAPFVSSFSVEAEGAQGSTSSGTGSSSNEGGIEPVRPEFLLINELLYDAVGSDTNGDVFVELYGEAGGDISGYQIAFVNGDDGKIYDTIKLADNSIIPDDGIFLIADAKTGESGVSAVAGAELVINFDPQNGPDCMQLLDEKGGLIDALGYGTPIVALAENGLSCFEGTPAADVASGKAVSRSNGQDTGHNELDFQGLDTPTPGSI